MNQLKRMKAWRPFHEARHQQHGRAALVGLAAGAVALAFEHALHGAEGLRGALLSWLHGAAPGWGWAVLPVLAACIGAGVAWFTARFAPDASGSGIPQVKGVLMHVGTLSWKRILPAKFLGGVLCIGVGFSSGREGPTVQMAAAMGKLVAQVLRVPAKAMPRLMACGAGAGLAAAFHAPLAGFIFTVEELQREFSSLTYAMALIAAVIADLVATGFSGNANAFHSAGFPAASLWSLPVCVVVGLLNGLCGAVFNSALLRMQDFTRAFPRLRPWHKGALAGIAVGVAAWWIPEAIGGGHQVAESILHGQFIDATSVRFLLALFLLKFALTLLCYATGVPGGIFAPMLVMGASLGLLTGLAGAAITPAYAPIPQSFAPLGMAAFFAAVVRAPLTGIVLVLEMTGDYEQLLPLLVASMVAYLLSERLGVRPIYDALLAQDLQRKDLGVAVHHEPILLEFVIEEESELDGRQLKELDLPKRCLFVTISRHGHDLLPVGDTQLHRGDHVTAVLSGEEASASVAKVLAMSKV